jgi:hypothetical protein
MFIQFVERSSSGPMISRKVPAAKRAIIPNSLASAMVTLLSNGEQPLTSSSYGGISMTWLVPRKLQITNPPIDLDLHRGMEAQKATELRRLLAEVEKDAQALRTRQDELEAQLAAAPAEDWLEAAAKARYLLRLFAETPAAQDPRRQKLITNVLEDLRRLGLPE